MTDREVYFLLVVIGLAGITYGTTFAVLFFSSKKDQDNE